MLATHLKRICKFWSTSLASYFACISYACRFSPRLRLTSVDRAVMASSYLEFAIQKCIHDIQNATSHHAVAQALNSMKAHLLIGGPTTKDAVAVLYKFQWTDALER
jgi:hypothetical protein